MLQIIGQLLTLTNKGFYQSLRGPKAAQKAVQEKITHCLVASEYGKSLNIKSSEDWKQIPIVTYDDIQHWISRGRQTRTSYFTSEPILFYEPTSGSRGKVKLIPYTASLRRSFSHTFSLWAEDIIRHGPPLTTGKIYISVSPKLQETSRDVNVGLEDDSEYLNPWLRWLVRPFLVSLPGLNKIRTAAEFKEQLCLTLLQEEKLEMISIWSPTFLKVHLDYIQEQRKELWEKLKFKLRGDWAKLLLEPEIPWTEIWPNLKLISCWDQAQAKDPAAYLRSFFPQITVQGKGLLATEAPMTVPLIPAKGCVPVLDEVFFEFKDRKGNIAQLHQLEEGKEYSVIISQKGGLYRYLMGDRVRVSHYYLDTPCLEFMGRTEGTSDLVGEKLQSDFVRDMLEDLDLQGAFFKSLVPVTQPQPQPHHILLLDRANRSPKIIAVELEKALSQSYHYRLARQLGQLSTVEVLVSEKIPEIMTMNKMKKGIKWGDIKHEILETQPIDSDMFHTEAQSRRGGGECSWIG